jgi:hypothetical protein
MARLTRRAAAAVAASWHRAPPSTDGPNDGACWATVDDFRQMRAEACRREARTSLEIALLP